MSKIFHLIMIKPSQYDEDGYVIQWGRSSMPSNTLAVIFGLAIDCAQRHVLGSDVEIKLTACNETNTRIKLNKIAKKIRDSRGLGLVCLIDCSPTNFLEPRI